VNKMIHVQRLILMLETRAHKELLRITIDGLKNDNGNPVTEGMRVNSQFKALGTLIRILEEWKTNVHSSELKTSSSFRNFANMMIDSILRSVYVNSMSRNISHKWTILLCDFIQMSQWLRSGLKQLLEELFKVQCAGSLHWLFVLIGIEYCTINPLSAQFPHLAEASDKSMQKAVQILISIGRSFSKQWINSLHSKLSREYGLLGFIFDEIMFASQQPKLVWATAKPSFGGIYNENNQNSTWFDAPGSPYIQPTNSDGTFAIAQMLGNQLQQMLYSN
jgi:hypothetical protein